jgi:hypothetical protein
MSSIRRLYVNEKWDHFSERVKARDGNKCMKCNRGEPEIVLQVHHLIYTQGKAPWDSALSDCITLCRGCHAREHGEIEPTDGWTLVCINDLGDLCSECERRNCGTPIRYEHFIYHPEWGYMVVGSTCVEYLTQEDQLMCSSLLKQYKAISKFVHESEWDSGVTKSNTDYIFSTYKHHMMRIYGKSKRFAYQILLKDSGSHWFNYSDIVNLRGTNLNQAKEIAYIVLKGTISESCQEKELLRRVYKQAIRGISA